MTTYLIRHADAGARGNLDDLDRPLSEVGQAQADRIGHELSSRSVTDVRSSIAVRCQQTLGPLARAVGTDVVVDDRLTEGGSAGAVVDLLVELIGTDVALCSHGDIIPEVMRMLALRGIEFESPLSFCAKGSIWQIDLIDDHTGVAVYRPAP